MNTIHKYLSTKIKHSKIKVNDDNDEIYKVVKSELERLGSDADLNHIDVSKVTSLYHVFHLMDSIKDLNPDISKWNVSNVTNMSGLFYECKSFNCDLSEWDVSNVWTMNYMFYKCKSFDQYLSNWNVEKVEHHDMMFYGCPIRKQWKPKFNRK